MYGELIKHVYKAKKYKELYKIPFKLDIESNMNKSKNINIILLCISCYGLGDIIFCLKIYNYIKKWYNIECTILTTKPEMFKLNKIKHVLTFKGSDTECQNPSKLKSHHNLKTYDLIFVTPWLSSEYSPNIKYLKKLFPYSNKFNTFIFSEYNAPKDDFDFPTGIGKNLMGLLITDPQKLKMPHVLKNKYIMSYIAEHDGQYKTCLSNFAKYVCKKYKNLKVLDFLIPKYVDDEFLKKLSVYITNKRYFSSVMIGNLKNNNTSEIYSRDSNFGVLIFRRIENLNYPNFVNLFRYCLPDILVTGDQSVTDIISCCHNYNIFYQTLPWKKSFATNLGKEMNNEYLTQTRKSCGVEKMSTKTKTNLLLIKKKYNFTTLGKPKLDNIINTTIQFKYNKMFKNYYNIVLNENTVTRVYKKLLQYQ